MARMIELNKDEVEAIERWCTHSDGNRKVLCPFRRWHLCTFGTDQFRDICVKICHVVFPSTVGDEHVCPCHILTLNYVTRTARKLIKENKNEKSIRRQPRVS